MWDLIKVILGVFIMVVIGLVIFVVSYLLSPVNPREVAIGGTAFPVAGIIVLIICLILDLKEK